MGMRSGHLRPPKKQKLKADIQTMYTKKDQFQQLLQPLYFLMQLSRTAYAKYSANKIFLHAETIRLANRKVYKLVTGKIAYIPEELQEDLLLLLNHYDTWFTQFRSHKKKLKPSLGDEFVFNQLDDQSAFPKSVETKIFKQYEQVKQEIASEIVLEQQVTPNR